MSEGSLEVRAVGPQSLIEDLGRPGHAALGVGPSGAADRGALRLANRLLGNAESAAGIEVTLGGLTVAACGSDLWVAVTGAPSPIRVADRPSGSYGILLLRDGDALSLGTPVRGLRTYVAVRGGVEVPAVLGSRSTDVLASVGPRPLAEGDLLPVGASGGDVPQVDFVPDTTSEDEDPVELRVVRGPRDDWVVDVEVLVQTSWTASERTNRVGMRLEGGRLEHRSEAQLPSEGAARGAVQVPPNGPPVVFLADHPVTGGYPVVGVVVDADVDRAAQIRPGQPVRLSWHE